MKDKIINTLICLSLIAFIILAIVNIFDYMTTICICFGLCLFALLLAHYDMIEKPVLKFFKKTNKAMLLGWVIWMPFMLPIGMIVGSFEGIGKVFTRAYKDIIE